jgi:hypothetical protein
VTTPRDDSPTDALLRAALLENLETVMTMTDTERELERFRGSLRRRGDRARLLTAAAAVLLVLAAVAGFVAVRGSGGGGLFAGGGSQAMTGELSTVLSRDVPATEQAQPRSDQVEARDGQLDGELVVRAGDEQRTGPVRMTFDWSFVPTGGGPVIMHGWGSVEATLDGQACSGSYAFSHYADPVENGGSLNLSCADGSALGARLVVTEVGQDATESWFLRLRLTDGHHFAG